MKQSKIKVKKERKKERKKETIVIIIIIIIIINYVKVVIILGCYFTPFCFVNNFVFLGGSSALTLTGFP